MAIFKKLLPNVKVIEPIIKHAQIIEKAMMKFPELFRAYFGFKNIDEIVKEITNLEREADKIKERLKSSLDNYHLTPFERSTIVLYIHNQDKIIDLIEDTSKLLYLNNFEMPEELKNMLMELVEEVKNAVDVFEDGVRRLERIFISDFSTREIEAEKFEMEKVEGLEDKVDEITLKIGRWIYSNKENYNPIDLMFLRNLALTVSEIADVSQNVVDMIPSILKK
ncbi:MAG TPA: DUF47 family protein [Thermotogaceae bacterium]|nr:DUF47 family protein [Thermotogaceae bacterium]